MRILPVLLLAVACAATPAPPKEPPRRSPCNVAPGEFVGSSYSLGTKFHRYQAKDGKLWLCPLEHRCLLSQHAVPNNKFIDEERCVDYCRCAPELF